MRRVVLDTTVIISSVLGGTLEFIMDGWLANRFTLVVSDAIMAEYMNVLHRPSFHLTRETIDRIAAYFVRHAEYVVPEEHLRVVVDDPSDDKFLEAAAAGRVDCIVSGDAHLLRIHEFRSMSILSASQFKDWLGMEE